MNLMRVAQSTKLNKGTFRCTRMPAGMEGNVEGSILVGCEFRNLAVGGNS